MSSSTTSAGISVVVWTNCICISIKILLFTVVISPKFTSGTLSTISADPKCEIITVLIADEVGIFALIHDILSTGEAKAAPFFGATNNATIVFVIEI